jgi:DNA-binding NarL/FixJ family response regulator
MNPAAAEAMMDISLMPAREHAMMTSENDADYGTDRSSIRILIATDQPVVELGLMQVLKTAQDLLVVGAGRSLREALTLLERLRPDLTLLDLDMKDAGDDGVLCTLGKLTPPAKIIAYTACKDAGPVLEAVKLGMQGYVPKGAHPAEIVRAIRSVHAGEIFLEPRIARQLLRHVCGRDTARPDRELSGREIEVLYELSQGERTRTIAHKLSISELTVRSHVRSISRKLNARNRSEAVLIASSRGLLSPPGGRRVRRA